MRTYLSELSLPNDKEHLGQREVLAHLFVLLSVANHTLTLTQAYFGVNVKKSDGDEDSSAEGVNLPKTLLILGATGTK